MSLQINTFTAAFGDGGLRPNLFTVYIPSLIDIQFFAKAASLPGSEIGQAIANYQGREIKLPGNRTFNDWTISVYLDPDFRIKDAFDKWSNQINSHNSNVGPRYINSFLKDATVDSYRRDGSIAKRYTLHSIWPSSISDVALDWSDNDNLAVMDVTLTVAEFWINPGVTS